MALSAMDVIRHDSVVDADSSTTVGEAAATGEGSSQPEGLAHPDTEGPPAMEGPPGIVVKEEAQEDGPTAETDGSTVAGVNSEANAEAASGHVSNEEQALAEKQAHLEQLELVLAEKLEQQEKHFEQQKKNLELELTEKHAQELQEAREARAKADESNRQARARAEAAEDTAARLQADQVTTDRLHARGEVAEVTDARQQRVDLSEEPDWSSDENMQHANQATRHNMDHPTHSEGCQWCGTNWIGDSIDLCDPEWAGIIWGGSIDNDSEITTFNNDRLHPDWASTKTNGEHVTFDKQKHTKMLAGLTSSMGSRDMWCKNTNGAASSIFNDWEVFQSRITSCTFDPAMPEHPKKFMVTWWKTGSSKVVFGCAHCFKGYSIDLPEGWKGDSKGICSNKQKKEWKGFKVVEYCVRDDKSTGRERNWTPPQCDGAQASADKARTPKAALGWPEKKPPQHMGKGHGGQQHQQHGAWNNWTPPSYGNHSGGSGGRSSGYDKQGQFDPWKGKQFNGRQSQGAGPYRQQPRHQDTSWSDGDGSYRQQPQHQDKGGYQREKGYQQYSRNDDQGRRVASHNDGDRRDDRDHRMASRDNNSRGRGSSDHDHGSWGSSDSHRDSRRNGRDGRDGRDGREQHRSDHDVKLHPRQDRRDNDSRDSRPDRSHDRRPSGGVERDHHDGDHTRSPRPRRQQDVQEDSSHRVRDQDGQDDWIEAASPQMLASLMRALLKSSSNKDAFKNAR